MLLFSDQSGVGANRADLINRENQDAVGSTAARCTVSPKERNGGVYGTLFAQLRLRRTGETWLHLGTGMDRPLMDEGELYSGPAGNIRIRRLYRTTGYNGTEQLTLPIPQGKGDGYIHITYLLYVSLNANDLDSFPFTRNSPAGFRQKLSGGSDGDKRGTLKAVH